MRKQVVIVGAGFGGLSAAKALGNTQFDVTIIDQHNYHLFQPLLYQVATAGLSPSDIASPIRSILSRQANTRMVLARVSGVDTARREVLAEGQRFPYDDLILATGAQHAYFGHDEWAAFAPGLKTIDDATYIRRRILLAFEKAETEPDEAERARLMTFVIVGGVRPASRWQGRSRSSQIARWPKTSAPSTRAARASFSSRQRRVCLAHSTGHCPRPQSDRSSNSASRCASARR